MKYGQIEWKLERPNRISLIMNYLRIAMQLESLVGTIPIVDTQSKPNVPHETHLFPLEQK